LLQPKSVIDALAASFPLDNRRMANELEVTGNLFSGIERHIPSNAKTLRSIEDKLQGLTIN